MRKRIWDIYHRVKASGGREFKALWEWAKRPSKWRSRLVRFQTLQSWAHDRALYHKRHGHTKRHRNWANRAEAYREQWRKIRRAHVRKQGAVVVEAGSPHWGGSDDILENEVEPVAAKHGVGVTSAKRSYSLGNPGSDHYTGNTTASARDFGTASNYALRDEIMRALGVSGSISDYGSYYITRAGRQFRVQPIASTHGTGPHLHIGIRLA